MSGVFRWLVSRRGYRGIKARQEAGSIGRQGYRSIRIDGRYCRASNVAWLLMTGEWPGAGLKVDHRNRAPADDRWENLRLATHAENMRNNSRPPPPSTGVVGVRRMGEAFQARIWIGAKAVHLGTFPTLEAAAAARQAAAQKEYGEFHP
jgi:hypothetical protein